MKHEDRLDKSYRNAKERETLLFRKPTFKPHILRLRRKWHIDANGLTPARLEDWKIWFAKIDRTYKPTEDDKAQEVERQKRLARNSKTEILGFEELLTEENLDLSHLTAKRCFYNDLGQLLIEYGLNPRWYSYLEHYLLKNKRPRVPSGMEFTKGIHEQSGQEVLYLTITEEIRKRDLQSVWAAIAKHQKSLPYYSKSKVQPKRALSRNKKVWEMHRDNASMKKICGYLNKNYPKRSGDYEYDDVYKILSEHRKTLK